MVNLRVRKLREPAAFRGLYLVSFEAAESPPLEGEDCPAPANEAQSERATELERELQEAREIHQGTIEELETANEELKSTNEELQSTNEELQSANEELETSKEEMQSLNEELQTVNAELQGKVEELSRANDDMKNLLNGTEIATIFLDNGFNIVRYTERAKNVIPLIPSDVGRPIGDLASNLRYDRLVDDAREVLRSLVFKEVEVRCESGTWYLMRILPYRTAENVIDGLVITFVEITKVKLLQQAERRMSRSLERSSTSLFAHDKDLRYLWAYGRPFGLPAADVVGKTDAELFPKDDAALLVKWKRQALGGGVPVRGSLRLASRGKYTDYELSFDAQSQGDGDEVVIGVCVLAPSSNEEGSGAGSGKG